MKKIKKQDITKILGGWQGDHSVFVPTRNGDGAMEMAAWDGRDAGFLEHYRNTVIPPKSSILPGMEKLFGFRKDAEGYHLETPPPEARPKLIFGIRPCDARALAIIDNVFKDAYEDTYYLSRRSNALLVGLGCANPYDSCFCTSLWLGPMEAADVDLMLIEAGDDYLIEEVTEKGKKLLAGTDGVSEASAEDEARAQKAREDAAARITRRLDTDRIKENLPKSFDNETLWEKLAAKCVSCGICTFLCPTCYCFDINDEGLKGDGARYRNWDSCSFPLYTKMPMENPREEKWRRVRQKVHHKYTFYPELFGMIACTGCGRCIRLCPVNWDITQILTAASAEAAGTESQHAH